MTTIQQHLRRGPSRCLLGPLPLGLLGPVALVGLATGCPSPDAKGKYERFIDETEEEREQPEPRLDLPPMDLAEGETFPDVTGVFLLAIETSIAPGLPLQFIADVQTDYDDMGTGTMAVEFQPLSLDVGSTTEPREEVGDSIVVDVDVTTGSFTIPFGVTMVTGMANPITGSDITADLSLQGSIRSENALCGAVIGQVQSPIMAPLDGSTFAAMRLADRGERPEMFPVSCDTLMDDGEGETEGETEATTGGSTSTGG